MIRMLKAFFKENDKKIVFTFLSLYILVIISMIIQLTMGNYQNVFYCILALILFLIPYFIDKKTAITLPNTLEITILFFIFATTVLGEIRNFYTTFPHWDTMLHTLSGFLCAAIGFSLVNILNHSNRSFMHLSPIFVALVAFCFSMTIGVLWEFFEFAGDTYLNKDMQKDEIVTKISSVKLNQKKENVPVLLDSIDKTIIYSNHYKKTVIIENGYLDIGLTDTMKDLFVNFIGAILFSVLGFFYLKKQEGYKIAELFIPKLKEKK